MKEYGQLLADDPAWAERARASSRARPRRHRSRLRAGRAARHAPSARDEGRVPRRLSPRARAGRAPAAARSAASRSPASRSCRSRSRRSAAAAPASTTWWSPSRRAARRPQGRRIRRSAPTSSRPRTQDACCRWRQRRGVRAAPGRFVIPSKFWMRRSPDVPCPLSPSEAGAWSGRLQPAVEVRLKADTARGHDAVGTQSAQSSLRIFPEKNLCGLRGLCVDRRWFWGWCLSLRMRDDD